MDYSVLSYVISFSNNKYNILSTQQDLFGLRISESSYLIKMARVTFARDCELRKNNTKMIIFNLMIILRRKTMIQLNPPITQPDFNRRMTKLSKSESTLVILNSILLHRFFTDFHSIQNAIF